MSKELVPTSKPQQSQTAPVHTPRPPAPTPSPRNLQVMTLSERPL